MYYNKAIVRRPSKSLVNGITTADLGKPSYLLALLQHEKYCELLKNCGLEVLCLDPMDNYPDSCFVEDTAIIVEDKAIISLPGDNSRRGESHYIKVALSDFETIDLTDPARLDGGDVLKVNDTYYVGLSKRTNEEGFLQLKSICHKLGYNTKSVPVKNVLHLKTGITHLENNTVITTKEFSGLFSGFNEIVVDEKDAYAANCLNINGTILMPSGYPEIRKAVSEYFDDFIEIEMSEFKKLDGGLTCLSILY